MLETGFHYQRRLVSVIFAKLRELLPAAALSRHVGADLIRKRRDENKPTDMVLLGWCPERGSRKIARSEPATTAEWVTIG
jgi:hypothetical protein